MSGSAPHANSIEFGKAWIVKPFVRFLEAEGCPAERYLLDAHLSPDLLEDDEAIVPMRLAIAFAERASRLEGIDHLGLRVAQTVTPDDLGGLRALMSYARNLHEYLDLARRFASSVSTSARYTVRVRGGDVWFHYSSLDAAPSTHAQLFTLGVTLNTFRAVAGADWKPADVVLSCGVAEGLPHVSNAFENVRVDPTAGSSSFLFPLAFLTLPSPASAADHGLHLGRTLEALDAGDLRHAVRRLMECLVLDGCAKVHIAADAAGLSVRTFQRRLNECGLVFSQVAEEARMSLAEQWLLQGGRPVSDIAASLGYTDPANFTRAFRRANGVPPSSFRASRRSLDLRQRLSL